MNRIGPFRWDSNCVLGEGGFGKVYFGCKHNSIPVAIKRVRTSYQNEEMIEREIRMMQILNHDHIVKILGHALSSKHVHIFMEYCNGGDLRDYVKKVGPMSLRELSYFLRQIGSAMRLLYDKNIVHRDLKPNNILLSFSSRYKSYPSTSKITFKIADFGLARFMTTSSPTICGTPIYTAPEILTGNKISCKSDLYSIGVIIVFCVLGKPDLKNLYFDDDDLTSLVCGLIKKRVSKRMEPRQFFHHPLVD
ncbi:serine/threonine-protein kinase ULK2 [Aethina tumida]|uniref:serine/threonine-protein kinase ULK2 n=1 Tax=Aethina tumida TaxID=116153 RepID=UPI002147286E|nr:serine/threonine-protein kinase ULK2 [Aethina tumida]